MLINNNNNIVIIKFIYDYTRKVCGNNIILEEVFSSECEGTIFMMDSDAGFCQDSASEPREFVAQLESYSEQADKFCSLTNNKVEPRMECSEYELRV